MVKKRLTNNEEGEDGGDDEQKGKKKSSKSAKKVQLYTQSSIFFTLLCQYHIHIGPILLIQSVAVYNYPLGGNIHYSCIAVCLTLPIHPPIHPFGLHKCPSPPFHWFSKRWFFMLGFDIDWDGGVGDVKWWWFWVRKWKREETQKIKEDKSQKVGQEERFGWRGWSKSFIFVELTLNTNINSVRTNGPTLCPSVLCHNGFHTIPNLWKSSLREPYGLCF